MLTSMTSYTNEQYCIARAIGDATRSKGSTSAIAKEIIGVWGNEVAAGQPYLEFNEDGIVNGNDGCNGIGSTENSNGRSSA